MADKIVFTSPKNISTKHVVAGAVRGGDLGDGGPRGGGCGPAERAGGAAGGGGGGAGGRPGLRAGAPGRARPRLRPPRHRLRARLLPQAPALQDLPAVQGAGPGPWRLGRSR